VDDCASEWAAYDTYVEQMHAWDTYNQQLAAWIAGGGIGVPPFPPPFQIPFPPVDQPECPRP